MQIHAPYGLAKAHWPISIIHRGKQTYAALEFSTLIAEKSSIHSASSATTVPTILQLFLPSYDRFDTFHERKDTEFNGTDEKISTFIETDCRKKATFA